MTDQVQDFASAFDRVADIEGWMSEGQAQQLWLGARRVPAGGQIVEIGSFHGRSTVILALGSDPSVQVTAIDPHAGNDRGPQQFEGFAQEAASDYEQFHQNLAAAGVEGRINHVRSFSSDAFEAVTDPIDLLYIDGSHRYRGALADLQDWPGRIRVGGLLLIHDSFAALGLTIALMQSMFLSAEFRYAGRERTMAIYERVAPLSPAGRATNLAKQLAELPWFARNLVFKVLLSAGQRSLAERLGSDGEWPY